MRSLTATLDRAVEAAVTTAETPEVPVSGGDFTPMPGEPIQPSPEVGALLRRAAAGLRAGRLDLALEGGSARSGRNDELLAHAWLAKVRAEQGDPVEAARPARIALEGRRPLELDTTVALLEILSGSLDQDIALDAAAALVELRRELVRRHPDSPTALRELSLSLNKVADIQRERGQLDDALTAYTQSLDLRQRILTTYGETPQALRDHSISLDNVANIQRERDDESPVIPPTASTPPD